MLKFLKDVFFRKATPNVTSGRPKDWKKTGTDLYNEMHSGLRSFIPQEELEWAVDYERSLIPSGYKFPKKGYVYEALEDLDVEIEVWYNAPGSGSDDGKLFKGEKVWIYYELGDKDIQPCLHPLEYKKLEERLVSIEFRELSFYAGYSIVIRTTTLNEKFRLIEKNYAGEQ
jgi:hypothetical protein